jgi:serine/threonine protein kinase
VLFALATAWRTTPFASAALPSPEGEVELDYVVGKGAYGHVHRALLAKTGQTVAVKVVFLNGKLARRNQPITAPSTTGLCGLVLLGVHTRSSLIVQRVLKLLFPSFQRSLP